MINFKRITIIGMGLMGGSMALALKKAGYNGQIIGYDIEKNALRHARDSRAIDIACENLQQSIKETDLVVLATPVGYYSGILQQLGEALSKDVIITDVGSVKGYVNKVVAEYLPQEIQFIGGHPMAGSEKGGIKAATPFLYENAYYFLTPNSRTNKVTIERLKDFVKCLGAYPIVVDVGEHDKIVAQISHIPHLAAVVLANALDRNRGISYIPFVGGGFRDTTRIAAGNPEMWRDIFFLNKKEVLEGIEVVEVMLEEFKTMLRDENKEKVLENLEKAKLIRDSIPHTARDYISSIYELIIDVEDRPGVLGELTQLMGRKGINIKEIEILHVREGEKGAIRIGLDSQLQQQKALDILKLHNFNAGYRKGGNGGNDDNK